MHLNKLELIPVMKNIPFNQKIFLIGFMGSGKSYWGRIWSAKTGLPHYDLDEEIEKKYKKTITEIFEELGENFFREAEQKALVKLMQLPEGIISCGGGTPCFYDNMEQMKSAGMVIYLQTTPAQILKNILSEPNKRPLVNKLNIKELEMYIENKLQEREPVYFQAKFVWETKDLDENAIDKVQEFF